MNTSLNKSSYDAIADEYYDSRHITSRNFDAATIEFCHTNKYKIPISQSGLVLEVGCGKGSVNKYFNLNLDRVVQTDISLKMLRISPREESLRAIQCSAIELPFRKESFVAVFAFLYDPYNIEKLYAELEEVLISKGVFIGTLPHFDWGSALRDELHIDKNKTRFRKFTSSKDNDFVDFDSFLTDDDQIQHFLSVVGLRLIDTFSLVLPPYIKNISPHIELAAKHLKKSPYDLPIVKMIVAKK